MSSVKVEAPVIVKIEDPKDEEGNAPIYNEKANVELSMSISSGSIGMGSLTSSTKIIDAVRSDVDTYLGGGGFNSSDRTSIFQAVQNGITTTYEAIESSITVDNCSWNEDRTVNNVSINITVKVTLKDGISYSFNNESTQKIIGSNPKQSSDGTYTFTYSSEDSELNSYVNLSSYTSLLNQKANVYIANNIQNNPNNVGGGTSFEDNENNIFGGAASSRDDDKNNNDNGHGKEKDVD